MSSREALRRLGASFCALCEDEQHARPQVERSAYDEVARAVGAKPSPASGSSYIAVPLCYGCWQRVQEVATRQARERGRREAEQRLVVAQAVLAADKPSSREYLEACRRMQAETDGDFPAVGGIFGSEPRRLRSR